MRKGGGTPAARGCGASARMWGVGLGLALAVVGVLTASAPFHFRDGYRSLAAVDATATTALVDPRGTGTVRLPYAPAELALDPSGRIILLATVAGVAAYTVSGDRTVPLEDWRLAQVPANGVAWLAGGQGIGIATPSAVAVYGLVAAGGRSRVERLAEARVPGAVGLAAGPATVPFSVLVATGSGVGLYGVQGQTLHRLPGAPAAPGGVWGIASTVDGAVAATWGPAGVAVWLWDGGGYRRASGWDPPSSAATDGPVAGVAFFPRGRGYWVLGRWGVLRAYAFGPDGVVPLPALSVSLPAKGAPPITATAGWGADGVAVLFPDGWSALAATPGAAPTQEAAWSLSGSRLAVYQPRAVLQGVPLTVDHPVQALRAEDADCPGGGAPCAEPAQVPAGTGVRYALSAAGCQGWVQAQAAENVSVPAGTRVCYRLELTTRDPRVTPVVDVTNLYELALHRAAVEVGSLLCLPGACPGGRSAAPTA